MLKSLMIMPLFIPLYFILISCRTTAPAEEFSDSPIPADSTIVFTGVDLITMEGDDILHDMILITKHGRIDQIGREGDLKIPGNAIVLNASGKYMMPGLIDMHVHVLEEDIEKYVAYGVTTVRNMWGTPDKKIFIQNIGNGTQIGPAIYSSSPGIDGTPPTWPYTQIIEDPEDAPGLVGSMKEEGWAFLKLYNQLKPDVYHAIAEAADSSDIRFFGSCTSICTR